MTKIISSGFYRMKPILLEKESVLVDWNRAVYNGQIFVDGKDVRNLVKKDSDNTYFNERTLEDFFKTHLLKNIADTNKKEAAIKYLMKSSHQGGLLYPTSNGVMDALGKHSMILNNNTHETKTYFVTSKHGFTVQEIIHVKSIASINGNVIKEVTPDKDKSSVFDAQATLDIDFENKEKKGHELKISLISATVAYGNEKLKSIADCRTLLQKIVDWFKSTFNLYNGDKLSLTETDQNNCSSFEMTPCDCTNSIEFKA